jgi:quercetin dioxygenase-like cupin family protein
MDIFKMDHIRPEPSRPEVLRSDEGIVRIIALALPRGRTLGDHEVHEHAWLMVLEGLLDVSCKGEDVEIGPGTVVHFDPGERRVVTGKEDTRMIYALVPWPGHGHPALTRSEGQPSVTNR